MMDNQDNIEIISRLNKRYYFQDKLFSLVNGILELIVKRKTKIPDKINKILIANAGHLGDIVLATAVVPILKALYPSVEIGFLIRPISKKVISNHPDIKYIHTLEHFSRSRISKSLIVKVIQYFKEKSLTLRDIERIRYDVAIDLRSWWPNYHTVLWKSKIPIRIGYKRLTLSFLLTHPVSYEYNTEHEVNNYLLLIKVLSGSMTLPKHNFLYSIPSLNASNLINYNLSKNSVIDSIIRERYIVIHPSSSKKEKDWSITGWRQLAVMLSNRGYKVIFTGHGSKDALLIDSILKGLNNSILNFCNALSWHEYIQIIRSATIVFTVDTVAGHIAAATQSPCIVLYSGISDYHQWAPINSIVIWNNVRCYPCLKKNGCRKMSCIKDISPEVVYKSAEEVLLLKCIPI